MKHFEDLWEESENLSNTKSVKESIAKIRKLLKTIDSQESFGKVLYELSAISKLMNINVYTALQIIVDEEKIDNCE